MHSNTVELVKIERVTFQAWDNGRNTTVCFQNLYLHKGSKQNFDIALMTIKCLCRNEYTQSLP